MPIVLHLFGVVRATWDTIPLKFATEHVRALLIYLVVEANITHPRTTLATLLWPDESERRARHNLRQALFFLKQTLRAVPDVDRILHITPTTLQWQSQGTAVDLTIFQQAWQFSQTHNHVDLRQCSICLEHFRPALACYQGEFLQSFLLKDNQPFEEWSRWRREQCHRQALTMFDALIPYDLARGAAAQASHEAAHLVALEPWHEAGHRYLMQALAAQGQPGAALRQYEQCRQILQQELGMPPSPETITLYEQLRLGTFVDGLGRAAQAAGKAQTTDAQPTYPVPRSNLPPVLPPLVGRAAQLAQLATLVGDTTQRLITLVGIGGMGKSRLALGLLEQLLAEPTTPFPHGFWFVPVGGLLPQAETLADALAGAVLKALGIITPNQEALSRALFHYLAQRQVLLVFDSFEHLLVESKVAAAASTFILDLLQAAPGLALVITSRLPLQLLSETVLRLEGLGVPPGHLPTLAPPLHQGDTAHDGSVQLFAYHAQRALPAFTLHDQNLSAVIELCRALSGMPLAIELAAALTPHFTPDELVVAIRQNLDLLVSPRRDLEARHRQLSAVLASSWQLLAPREQTILAQSSIFVGRFSRAAVQAVTGASVSELASLVDKALIQQAGVGIYQLHDLLRQFAAEKLSLITHEDEPNSDLLQVAANRHSAFYLNFVAVRERMLTRHQPRQAVAEIQQEVDNVRQAWSWAITHTTRASTVAAICAHLEASAYALWHFYLIVGLYQEGVAAFRQAHRGVQAALNAFPEAATPSWQRLLSKLLALEAYMLSTHGNYTEAPPIAQQAIAIGQAWGGHEGEIIGLLAIAQAHYHNGAPQQAEAAATEIVVRVPQLVWDGEPAESYYDVQFMAHLYRGVIAIHHDRTRAKAEIAQALHLCQSMGKLRGAMHARLNLANLERYQQHYGAARQGYQQALQLACELGYRRGEAITRFELADVMRGQGEYALALEQFTQALTLLREIGESFHENYAEADLARLYAYLGDFARARALVDEALLRSEDFTMLDAKLDTLLTAALLHQLTGAASAALPYTIRAQQLAITHRNRRYEGWALLYMGHALEGLARWREAKHAYANALQLYEQLDIQPTVAEAQAGLARTALALGDQAEALTWVEKILAILANSPTVGLDEPFPIYLTCYHGLAANHPVRARALLQQGYDLLQQYAERIPDQTLRYSFLEKVVAHRDLKQLYQNIR
ncbi:MAG: tetratricopeptide repeat protein [Caldilineaceae bacterium]|nr:tetratricopeptide repeat protein [Caldilineaceae bacterium]